MTEHFSIEDGLGFSSTAVSLLTDQEYDAESAFLSSMMLDGGLVTAFPSISPGSFGDIRHARIFSALQSLELSASGQVDPILLADRLASRNDLVTAGGKDYIGELMDVVPSPANASSYAARVERGSKRRRLLQVALRAADQLKSPNADPEQAVCSLQEELHGLNGLRNTRARFLSDEEIEQMAEAPFLIHSIIESNSVAALVGPSRSFKSFVALDIAYSIALGLDFHGFRVVRGPVVYICSEGASGMKKRSIAWKKYYSVEGCIGVRFFPSRLALQGYGPDVAWLAGQIAPAKPVLIIVDTLARNFVGAENDTADMNGFVNACDALKEATGATVLIVHHTGHENKERGRGNSSFPAALETEIICTRDSDRLTLRCSKQKNAEEFADLHFETIQFAGSIVLKRVDQHSGKLDGQRLACLKLVQSHFDEGGATFTEWLKAAGIARSSFSNAINWLLAQTYVRKLDGKHYGLTDAGRESLSAVSPQSKVGPSIVQSIGSRSVQPGGGLKTHPVDQRLFGDEGEAA